MAVASSCRGASPSSSGMDDFPSVACQRPTTSGSRIRGETPFRATIKGILRGDFPFPVERGYLVNLYYSADRAKGVLQVGHFAESGGPRFGPMKLAWEGEPSVSGLLVALGEHATKDKRWVDAFLASKPLAV